MNMPDAIVVLINESYLPPAVRFWLGRTERAAIIKRLDELTGHTKLLEACRAAFSHATTDPMARLDQPQLRLLKDAIADADKERP